MEAQGERREEGGCRQSRGTGLMWVIVQVENASTCGGGSGLEWLCGVVIIPRQRPGAIVHLHAQLKHFYSPKSVEPELVFFHSFFFFFLSQSKISCQNSSLPALFLCRCEVAPQMLVTQYCMWLEAASNNPAEPRFSSIELITKEWFQIYREKHCKCTFIQMFTVFFFRPFLKIWFIIINKATITE